MHRRRLLALLTSTAGAAAGCGTFDRGSSRTPYDPPADTVTPAGEDGADGGSNGGGEETVTPPGIRSRLTVSSRYDLPCPLAASEMGTCYHEVRSGTEAYLAPLSEHVPPTAREWTVLAFNRASDDLRLEPDRCSLHRLTDAGWEPAVEGIEIDASADAIEADNRRPAILTVPFPDGESADEVGLSTGTYALGVPASFDRSDSRDRRLAAVFSVEPAAELREGGRPLEPIRVENDRPTGDGYGTVSAELRRPATTAHPAIVRVRLRSFRRVSIQSSIRLHETRVERNGGGPSRLELALTTAFRDGCWRTTTPRTGVSLVTNTLQHGDEIAADFELGTPEDSCPETGRYRFADVFRLRQSSLETGFTIRYGSG